MASPRSADPTVIATQHVRAFAGPLPAPETLAEYDRCFPGLAERIVRMTEAEQAHRRANESRFIAIQEIDI